MAEGLDSEERRKRWIKFPDPRGLAPFYGEWVPGAIIWADPNGGGWEAMEEPGVWREYRLCDDRGDRRNVMPEQLKVTVDGEIIVLVAEGEAGTCEVRLNLDEVERFEEVLDQARKRAARARRRAVRARERARAREAMKVVNVDDEDFEEAE
jgi:hypothetical protein